MQGNKSRNLFYYWIIFLVSPFFAFILVLRKGFNVYYQPVILAFAFMYGYHVFVSTGDITRYAETYEMVRSYSWRDFWFLITHRLDAEALSSYPSNVVNRKPDVFAFILQFVTSRLSESPRLFWGLVSLINTKFMLMFFNKVYAHIGLKPKGILHYTFIFFLILVVPFYVGVTGVRFWPALFLFMYFLLKYIGKKDLKYLFGASLSMLIHYSFFIPVLVILIFHFIPLKKNASKLLIIISLVYFVTSSTTSIFSSFQTAVEMTEGTTVGENVEGYADQDLLEQRLTRQSQTNWYVSLKSDLLFYILILSIILEFFGIFKFRETEFTQKLHPYILMFFCLALLTYHLGSIGRFVYIYYLLALARYAVIFPINYMNRRLKSLSFILIPTLILYTAVTFRAGLYTVDSYFPVNNSISLFFLESKESLSEFLVGH